MTTLTCRECRLPLPATGVAATGVATIVFGAPDVFSLDADWVPGVDRQEIEFHEPGDLMP